MTLRLDLSGVLNAQPIATPPHGDIASASVAVAAIVNGIVSSGQHKISPPLGTTSTGILSGLTGNSIDEIVSIPFFDVPTNTSINLMLQLTAGTSIIGDGNASSNFTSTLHLPTDRPVFIVPVDTDVNSAAAGIVANSYTLVPEPVTWAILTLGLGAAVVGRQRRKNGP